jgi:outer membrane protein OmpA-like peptidoglycan-associated protein
MAASDRRRGILLPITVTILGLAAIGVIEDIPVRHSIEHKLTVASTNALAKAGVTVEGVSFSGRDGTVRVDSAAGGAQALAVVKAVDGVRVVRVIVTGEPSTTPVTSSPTPTVSLTAIPSGSASASPAPSASAPSSSAPAPSGSPSAAPAPSGTASAAPSATPTAPGKPSPSASSGAGSPGGGTGTGSGATLAQVQAKLNALGEVTFASGSSALTGHDRVILGQVARIMAANPRIAIRVQGNTDSTGSAAANLTMSRRRAQAVASALHALGVPTSRMTIVAYGETRPLVPNDSPGHRAMNRRVDFLATEV